MSKQEDAQVRIEQTAEEICIHLRRCESEEERDTVLRRVFDEFCQFCGAEQPCYCMRDD